LSPIARAAPFLLLALAACAGARPLPAPAQEIAFEEPLVVEAGRADLDLVDKNDEELFAIGSAAFGAGDHRRAAAAFGRVADLFPASKRHPAALYDAGLAHERLEEWRPALARFRALEKAYVGPDADEGSFRVAECLWHLGELAGARTALDALARRTDLGPMDHIRALAQRGVVELDLDDAEAAERSLRLALSAWQEAKDRERLDDYYPAQAQYYLGEVYRRHFQAVRLDPARDGEEKLGSDLETKAEMLLSAQGHYLRAIRIGNPDWAVASGFRIGELYDELYAQMTGASPPPGLDAEHEAAYREELRRKVRVLVTKAIAIYESTLATARRTGVENRFVERTQSSLERMKKELLVAEVPPPAPASPDADPSLSRPGD
jgi:tetratricopeptide (TPR) repeat protein